MRVLVLGLYTEGSTDQDFLQPVIQRTVVEILAKHDRGNNWDDVFIMPIPLEDIRPHEGQDQKILSAAISARGCHLLIIHADADSPTSDRAFAERFEPGLKLVKRVGTNVCQDLLPIIPIQEIEAWLLADEKALLRELETNKRGRDLGIPPLRRIEALAQPKERLDNIIRIANQSRRRKINREDLYEPLGETVRLERLASLSAYQEFISDLTNAFIHLGIISPTLQN